MHEEDGPYTDKRDSEEWCLLGCYAVKTSNLTEEIVDSDQTARPVFATPLLLVRKRNIPAEWPSLIVEMISNF
jgi:hypothetical protein